MEIKIVRSSRRLRTVSGRLIKDTLLINAPLVLSKEKLDKIVADFKQKFERKIIKNNLDKSDDLVARAARINEKYFLNKLKIRSIQYVTGQNSRFGCCNYHTADIRISHKVGLMPEWVRDYVVLHEMAHLVEPNHGLAFWEIVNRYKLSERAKGFLMGSGFNSNDYAE